MKALTRCVVLGTLLFPACAWALGLGRIDVRSRLDEPFAARIALVGAQPAEMAGLKVGLADAATVRRVGAARTALTRGLRLEVVRQGGRAYISVRGKRALREPVLDFVVEAAWPGGRVLREYSVLMKVP